MAKNRNIYLINSKFQLKFSFYVCILVLLSSVVYPFSIYELMNTIIVHFTLKNPEIAGVYTEKRDALILFLVMLHLGVTALSFFICIFFSHKIAGPLYNLQKHLAQIKEGKAIEKLIFRKGDYFQELADEVNDTFFTLEERYKNDLVYLSEVNSYINNLMLVVPDDKRVVLAEITTRLNVIQDRFTKQ